MTRTIPFSRLLATLFLAVCATHGYGQSDSPGLDGRTVNAARHRIMLTDAGLPAQIVIQPRQHELPFAVRGKPGELSQDLLDEIGRGEQLREPIRFNVVTDQGEQTPEVTEVATAKVEDGVVKARSTVQAGGVTATLSTRFTAAGAMLLDVDYGGNATVDAMSLVVPLRNPVDVAIPGDPANVDGPIGLAPGLGIVWGNSKDDAGEFGRAAPGVLTHLFVGDGDRGFTLLTDGGEGWTIDPNQSMATLQRNEQGQLTLTLHIINTRTDLTKTRSVQLALVTHPAANAPDDFRARQWSSDLDAAPASPALRLATLEAGQPIGYLAGHRAAFTPLAEQLIQLGPAAGDLGDAARDVTDLASPSLYRYLTGTHTGLVRRIVPRNTAVTTPGADPAPDRMILGRALLHDAGVDLRGLANASEAAELMSKLARLGFFEPGEVEVIPYWRSGTVLRYGPEFRQDNAFAVTTANPFRDVHVTTYRVNEGKTAVIVVVNEGDEPVRDVLYLLDEDRLLGGRNAMTAKAIIDRHIDFSKVPQNGDWRKTQLTATPDFAGPALMDLESGATVPAFEFEKKKPVRDYGRLYIPARNFRIIIASSE